MNDQQKINYAKALLKNKKNEEFNAAVRGVIAEAVTKLDALERHTAESEQAFNQRINEVYLEIMERLKIIRTERAKNGKDGRDGKDGRNGLDGKNGVAGLDGVGVAKAELAKDELVITLTNGTSFNVGKVKGKDGTDGRNGMRGGTGESAYEAAAKGGYTGTKDEFYTALANMGSGDMDASVYDPNGVEADVFDVDNHVNGTTNKVFTATEQSKLSGIADNANNYSLPTASTSVLGGVKVDGTSITITEGVISAAASSTGDMTKAVYDTDGDGKVNAAAAADTVGGHSVGTDVPAGAVFTDTTYASSDFDIKDLTDSTSLRSTWSGKQDALGFTPLNSNLKGAASGLAELDESGKVPTLQLPSYVDDVLEYANESGFPATGETGKIYIALDNNKTFRWGGSAYTEISSSLALGETSATAYRGDRGKTAYDHSQVAHAPSNAQKNSDILKSEIEAVLTGTITSHGHNAADITESTTKRFVTDTEKSTWGGKQDALTFDSSPTNASTNPVTSGGVYTALSNKSALPASQVLTGYSIAATAALPAATDTVNEAIGKLAKTVDSGGSVIGSVWVLHTSYTTAGTFTFTAPDLFNGADYEIGVFIVGAGGSGGCAVGISTSTTYYILGGGGASGRTKVLRMTVSPAAEYTVIVGAGGAAIERTTTGYTDGNDGAASSFNSVAAAGGKGGKSYQGTATTARGGADGGQGSNVLHRVTVNLVAPAMGESTLLDFTDTGLGGKTVSVECFNPFDYKRYLSAGGNAYVRTTSSDNGAVETAQTLDDGNDGSSGVKLWTSSTPASLAATASESIGSGGGGAALAVYRSSATVTATSAAGADGAVLIYVRGVA